ncbi:MAG: MerR family transcriptional regulator [Lachnospiraceae bacterium]|nr:MerR family transcriptional regulator [Lachnospiraceae bacterium]
MNKKMTSGEIAKKAGVSQKAVRLYDEKGLLKPSDYSEGNYRLYDKAALQVLEKIVALKQIGFSLEEIRDNLAQGEASNVEEALRIQLKNMEEKKYRIEKVISAINRTFDRKTGDLDWDDVSEMIKNINLDQSADERHWDALKHTAQEEDWYVKIFRSFDLNPGMKILDLGCGYAKLWRNNRDDIPENTKIFGYDVHGSWADDFEKYLSENKDAFPKGVNISLTFDDLEDESAWKKIAKNKGYDLIIAHYINYELKDSESFVKRASKVLGKGGVFSFNAEAVSGWHYFYKEILKNAGLNSSFIDEMVNAEQSEQDARDEMLKKYFKKVDLITIENTWHFTEADELFEKMCERYSGHQKYLNDNRNKIIKVFEDAISKDGEITYTYGSLFRRCMK